MFKVVILSKTLKYLGCYNGGEGLDFFQKLLVERGFLIKGNGWGTFQKSAIGAPYFLVPKSLLWNKIANERSN